MFSSSTVSESRGGCVQLTPQVCVTEVPLYSRPHVTEKDPLHDNIFNMLIIVYWTKSQPYLKNTGAICLGKATVGECAGSDTCEQRSDGREEFLTVLCYTYSR